jgi:hypothetical protein
MENEAPNGTEGCPPSATFRLRRVLSTIFKPALSAKPNRRFRLRRDTARCVQPLCRPPDLSTRQPLAERAGVDVQLGQPFVWRSSAPQQPVEPRFLLLEALQHP